MAQVPRPTADTFGPSVPKLRYFIPFPRFLVSVMQAEYAHMCAKRTFVLSMFRSIPQAAGHTLNLFRHAGKIGQRIRLDLHRHMGLSFAGQYRKRIFRRLQAFAGRRHLHRSRRAARP